MPFLCGNWEKTHLRLLWAKRGIRRTMSRWPQPPPSTLFFFFFFFFLTTLNIPSYIYALGNVFQAILSHLDKFDFIHFFFHARLGILNSAPKSRRVPVSIPNGSFPAGFSPFPSLFPFQPSFVPSFLLPSVQLAWKCPKKPKNARASLKLLQSLPDIPFSMIAAVWVCHSTSRRGRSAPPSPPEPKLAMSVWVWVTQIA